MSSVGLVNYCDPKDHPEWGSVRRNVAMYVELTLILCSVVLAQTLKGYGHGYAYMLAFAICALALKMMPHAFGWFVLGTSNEAPWAATFPQDVLVPTPLLTMINHPTVLTIIVFQWLATIAAGVVAQASGSFVWFENLLVKFFAGKKGRFAMPISCACLGVFSSLACGTDAINLLYLTPIINASKVIGIRPSKSLSAVIVAGMLGAACSPVNPAVQYYYNRIVDSVYVDTTPWTYNISGLLPYDSASIIAIPAAVVGALIAGVVATFIGRDLETSRTYQARLKAGRVASPGEEDWYEERRIYTEKTSEGQNGQDATAASTNMNKLEREFSMQSRLEEGDYVYTTARFRDGSYVDINDRQGSGGQGGRKSVTINVKEQQSSEKAAATTTTDVVQMRPHNGEMKPQAMTQKKSKAYLAVGLLTAAGVFVLLWGILKAIERDEPAPKIDYVIPKQWPLPTGFVYCIVFMAISGVVMVANNIKSWQLNHGRFVKYALVGSLGSFCYIALGSSWLEEWSMATSCMTFSSKATRDHAFTWIFWVALTSAMSGNEGMTQLRLANRLSGLEKPFNRVRWIASGIPMASCSFLLPTNGNMIAAAELDDTGSTRLGTILIDHVFIVPGLCGAITAFGVAYGISVGIFP